MATWVCGNDDVEYAVGAPCCPECGANDPHEKGDPTMAKISRHGGPSSVDDPNLPPVLNEETGERVDRQDAERTDAEHVSWTDRGRENLVVGVDEDAAARADEARARLAESEPGSAEQGERSEDGPDETGDAALAAEREQFRPADAEPATVDEDDVFDPGQHTVSQVNEYLEAQDDDVERRRVLDAERAGRNRSGVRGLNG